MGKPSTIKNKKSAGRPKKNFWDCQRGKEVYLFLKSIGGINDYEIAKLMTSTVSIDIDTAKAFIHRLKNAQIAAINPQYLISLASVMNSIEKDMDWKVPIFAKAHIIKIDNDYKRTGHRYVFHALTQQDCVDAISWLSPRDITIDIAEFFGIADINIIDDLEPTIAELILSDGIDRRQLRTVINGIPVTYLDGDPWELTEKGRALMPLLSTMWTTYKIPRLRKFLI